MKPGVPGHVRRWRGRARDLTDRALALPGAAVIQRFVRELATASLSDRSMTLLAQAFTLLLPVVILLTTLPVGRTSLDDALENLGVNSTRLDVSLSASVTTSSGVIGALITISGATSLARAPRRTYLQTFRVNIPLWQG